MLCLFYIILACILSVVSYRIIMDSYVLGKPKDSRVGLIFLLVGYCCFEWYLGIMQSVNGNFQSNDIFFVIEWVTYWALCFAGCCFSAAGFLIAIIETAYICIEFAGIIKNFLVRNPKTKPLLLGLSLVIASSYLKNLEFVECIYILTFPLVMQNFLYQLKSNN